MLKFTATLFIARIMKGSGQKRGRNRRARDYVFTFNFSTSPGTSIRPYRNISSIRKLKRKN